MSKAEKSKKKDLLAKPCPSCNRSSSRFVASKGYYRCKVCGSSFNSDLQIMFVTIDAANIVQ